MLSISTRRTGALRGKNKCTYFNGRYDNMSVRSSNDKSYGSEVNEDDLFTSIKSPADKKKPSHVSVNAPSSGAGSLRFDGSSVLNFPDFLTRQHLDVLLLQFLEAGVDDTEVATGIPLTIKINGSWVQVSDRPLSFNEVGGIVNEIDSPTALARVLSGEFLQFAHAIRSAKDQHRFRGSGTHILGAGGTDQAISLTLRTIPGTPPSVGELGLPSAIIGMTQHRAGLVIVCGPVGSGKTTTSASLVRHILEDTSGKKIVEVSDPIEYVHDKVKKKSFIQQSEVKWFSGGWKDVGPNLLRRNPDIAFFGEAPDSDAMEAAVKFSAHGKLVMVTLHANSVAATVDRMADEWPAAHRSAVIKSIIANLRGIVHQRLVRSVKPNSRVPIFGILEFTQDMRDHLGGLDSEDILPAITNYVNVNGVSEFSYAKKKFDEGLIHPDDFNALKREFQTSDA